MKILYTFLAIILVSCVSNNESEDILKNTNQTWKLIQMSGSIPNSETIGENMNWQEEIELKENGTFLKTRVRDGITVTISGNYTFLELEDGTYLELSFTKQSDLIGNCYGNLKEMYWIISSTQLRGTWLACDGPGLEYGLVN